MASRSSSGHALLKRNKRAVALLVKSECSRPSGHSQLNDLLNQLLDPAHVLADWEKLDWLRCLIASGETFDEFSRTVRRYDNATTCGLVWTADFVAYRCRTCGISPCMSLCAECFQSGNHQGHDFNMFRSQAGGACDCGDDSVMKELGFCSRHGSHRLHEIPPAPPELLSVATAMLPRMIFRLLQYLRDNCPIGHQGSHIQTMETSEQYLQFLSELSDLGIAMKSIIAKALTNPVVYTELCQGRGLNLPNDYVAGSQERYESATKSLGTVPPIREFKDMPDLIQPLHHINMVDELFFWMVKFEFPQKLVTFLLSLLPDEPFKEQFCVSFVKHYGYITCSLIDSTRRSLSSRVVHISVQLLSPQRLAHLMVQSHHLLEILLTSLHHVLQHCIMEDVVDCSNNMMKEHCYWPLVSDLINLLSHKSVVEYFIEHTTTLDAWMNVVMYFQGTNLNHREMIEHIQFEPETYYAAFSAELEICASVLWTVLNHAKDSAELMKKLIQNVVKHLAAWFIKIGFKPQTQLPWLEFSYHIPLHRYLAICINTALRHCNITMAEVLPSSDQMIMLIAHPLQALVATEEIYCGVWVRNGLQIRGQAMTYGQCHFSNSMIDADIFLLQLCATRLHPDFLLRAVLERFQVFAQLTFNPVLRAQSYLDIDKEPSMLEGCLTVFSLMLNQSNISLSDAEITRRELVALLVSADRTHSQLLDLLPDKCHLGPASNIQPILEHISEYRQPAVDLSGLQQGLYVPKDIVWREEYDPLMVMLRAIQRRDRQAAMERYCNYLKQSSYQITSPWPPFRVPTTVPTDLLNSYKLLHCRTFHGVVFTLLHKAVFDTLTDTALQLLLHLVNVALTLPRPQATTFTPQAFDGTVNDRCYTQWFTSDDLHTNLRQIISGISILCEHREPEITPTSGGRTTALNTSLNSVAGLGDRRTTGINVNMDAFLQTRILGINESCLTLLFKLHKKLSDLEKYTPPVDMNTVPDTVAQGHIVVLNILKKIAQADAKSRTIIQELSSKEQVMAHPELKKVNEQKREKARQRQQKLMAEFANRQRDFMKHMMEEEVKVEEDLKMKNEELFDCVICSVQETSTDERPLALVCYVQNTAILGHQRLTDTTLTLPQSTPPPPLPTLSRASEHRLTVLQQLVQEASVGVYNDCWGSRGISVSTCGHTVHLQCHSDFLNTLDNTNSGQLLENGEFLCPLCRQISNTVLPILPGVGPALTKPLPQVSLHMCRLIGDTLKQRPKESLSGVVSAACGQIMKDLRRVLEPVSHEGPDHAIHYITSTLRSCLEVDILQRGGSPCLPVSSSLGTKKSAFCRLLQCLAPLCKVFEGRPTYTLWYHLSGVMEMDGEGTGDVVPYQDNVPVLIHDTAALLMKLIVALPRTIDKEVYLFVIQCLFNVTYIQALCQVSLKFTDEERCAWKTKPTDDLNSLQCLLGIVINHLSLSCIYEEEPTPQSFYGSVWTPHSVEVEVQTRCLPFLRTATLLQHHMFGTPLPQLSNIQNCVTEFRSLSTSLGLTPAVLSSEDDDLVLSSTCCIKWFTERPADLVHAWLHQLNNSLRKQPQNAKALVQWPGPLYAPVLVSLPEIYNDLFQHYRSRPCTECKSIPKDPAVCLMCGALVCFKEDCCQRSNVYESVQHASMCGGSTALLLIIHSSLVVIISGPRATIWGSLYLDEHGEEDRDLRRGKPLYLSNERYQLLTQQWISLSFDRVCKKWIQHKNFL